MCPFLWFPCSSAHLGTCLPAFPCTGFLDQGSTFGLGSPPLSASFIFVCVLFLGILVAFWAGAGRLAAAFFQHNAHAFAFALSSACTCYRQFLTGHDDGLASPSPPEAFPSEGGLPSGQGWILEEEAWQIISEKSFCMMVVISFCITLIPTETKSQTFI